MVTSDSEIINKLFTAIGENRALAIIEANTRQVLDNFNTKETSRIIRILRGIDK